MKCDKCKTDADVQKFHKPYADYCKLDQVNGFCKKCWYEIVTTYGTWLDIQKSKLPKQLKSPIHYSFKREFEYIWGESSK